MITGKYKKLAQRWLAVEQVLELNRAIGTLLMSMMEENHPKTTNLVKAGNTHFIRGTGCS